jgi:hypothetical protein
MQALSVSRRRIGKKRTGAWVEHLPWQLLKCLAKGTEVSEGTVRTTLIILKLQHWKATVMPFFPAI